MSQATPFRKHPGRQYALTATAVIDFTDVLTGAPVVNATTAKPGVSVPGDVNQNNILNATGTSLTGIAFNVVEIPPNAVITGGRIIVPVAFNSGTSDTLLLKVGTVVASTGAISSIDATLLAATSIAATGVTAITLSSAQVLNNTSTKQVQAVWTRVGADPTAGKVVVQIDYIIPGRALEIQGV